MYWGLLIKSLMREIKNLIMFNALLIYISNDYKKVKQIETMLKKIA